jgi:hypothetical protein
VSQDLHTIDLEPYQHGGTNITGLRMVDPQSEVVQMTVKRWADLELKKGRNLSISPDKITVSNAICVCVCVCVCCVCVCVLCVCVVCVCVCFFFFNNIYLQHVPLPGNTTCSSIHMIH